MRAETAFIIAVCVSAVACATAQAKPSAHRAAVAASSSSDSVTTADRKAAEPNFTVNLKAASPLDLYAGAPRPASVAFAAAPAIPSERPVDPAFALSPAGAYGDANLLDANRYYEGRGPVSWRSSAVVVSQGRHAYDSVRMSVASVAETGQTRPLSLVHPDEDSFADRDVDVTLTRGWPAALKLNSGKYALDVTPHAGLGFGGAGGSAEAGATLRVGSKKSVEDRVTDSLGLRDGREMGDRGRWYMFAAASGQAVGMNMLRGTDGDWSRAGLTSDNSSKLVGDGQAGVAWRKGAMQASFGYVHRKIRAKDQIMGMATQKDEMVAFSFTLKPHW